MKDCSSRGDRIKEQDIKNIADKYRPIERNEYNSHTNYYPQCLIYKDKFNNWY